MICGLVYCLNAFYKRHCIHRSKITGCGIQLSWIPYCEAGIIYIDHRKSSETTSGWFFMVRSCLLVCFAMITLHCIALVAILFLHTQPILDHEIYNDATYARGRHTNAVLALWVTAINIFDQPRMALMSVLISKNYGSWFLDISNIGSWFFNLDKLCLLFHAMILVVCSSSKITMLLHYNYPLATSKNEFRWCKWKTWWPMGLMQPGQLVWYKAIQ